MTREQLAAMSDEELCTAQARLFVAYNRTRADFLLASEEVLRRADAKRNPKPEADAVREPCPECGTASVEGKVTGGVRVCPKCGCVFRRMR